MKANLRIYGNSRNEILFEGKVDLLDNVKYAIVVWPVGSNIQHLIWDNEYYEPVLVENLKEDFVYWYTWDD